MASPFATPQVDFGAIQGIGTIPQRLRERKLRDQFSSGALRGPNGELDFQKMIEALGAVDPGAGAKLAGAQFLTPYQQESLAIQRQNAERAAANAGTTTAQRDAEFFANLPPGDPRLKYAPRGNAKPLNRQAVNDLSGAGEAAFKTNEFINTFKDDYAGWGSATVGDTANAVARNTGFGNVDAAEWWQNYNRTKNVTRNKLFGSALTSQEKSEWEKADINPGMQPEIIKKNLAIQKAAQDRAARKLANVYIRQGADQGLVEDALGVSLDEIGGGDSGQQSAAPQSLAPGHVVDGYRFKGGDPNDQSSWEKAD